MKHFYGDNIPQSPVEAQEAESRAISQEESIFSILNGTGQEWTAWQLCEYFKDLNWQITSCRRCLTNLEKQGKIIRTGFFPGPFGVKTGKYQVFTGKLF